MSSTSKRDNVALLLSIITLSALAWAYLIHLAADRATMTASSKTMSMVMPALHTWGLPDFLAMFAMWSVMMVAMMLPSATPMILLFEKLNQKRASQGRPTNPMAFFIGGYLLIWVGFSVFATLLNWGLHAGGNMTSMMGRTTPVIAGVSLVAAGVFQWTPLKYACLSHCRSPLGFLMSHWHEGRAGAVRMGLHHGLYCLGCCWLLMVLLFVLGVMNLLWIVALSLLVLAEKVVPAGRILVRISGLLMITWGAWLFVN